MGKNVVKRWGVLGLLWLICVSAVLISLGLGRALTSPNAFNALQIAECDGSPCIQGIILGSTLWTDVKVRFMGLVDSNSDGHVVAVGSTTPIHTTFLSNDASGRVSQIIISSYSPAPTLTAGDLVAKYGAPCKTRIYVTGSIVLIYSHLIANIGIPRYLPRPITRLDTKQTADEITYFAQAKSCELEKYEPDTDSRDMPWLGFTTLKKYYHGDTALH